MEIRNFKNITLIGSNHLLTQDYFNTLKSEITGTEIDIVGVEGGWDVYTSIMYWLRETEWYNPPEKTTETEKNILKANKNNGGSSPTDVAGAAGIAIKDCKPVVMLEANFDTENIGDISQERVQKANRETATKLIKSEDLNGAGDFYKSMTKGEITSDQYVERLRDEYPEVYAAKIYVRDRLMAGRLHWLVDQGYEVLAVVGLMHLPGISHFIHNPESIPDDQLSKPGCDLFTSAFLNMPDDIE